MQMVLICHHYITATKHFQFFSCTLKRLGTRLQFDYSSYCLYIISKDLREAAAVTSFSSQREKAWVKYHCLCCTTIPDLCDEFLRDQLKIKDTNSLLIQTSDDEKNTLSMHVGYVPLVLIRRYQKRKEHKINNNMIIDECI